MSDEVGGRLEIRQTETVGYRVSQEGGLVVEESDEFDRSSWRRCDLSGTLEIPCIRTTLGEVEMVADLQDFAVFLEVREGQIIEVGDDDSGMIVRIRPKLYKQE